DEAGVNVHLYDELNVWAGIEASLPEEGFANWETLSEPLTEEEVLKDLEDQENTAYIFLTEDALQNGNVKVYMSEDVDENTFLYQVSVLEHPLLLKKFEELGLSGEEIAIASQGVQFEPVVSGAEGSEEGGSSPEEVLSRVAPALFGGVILFSILITGMMIFQSASQEKKEKVAEIVLSSLKPEELMQGKIL